MRATIDLSEDLINRLQQRALEERLTLELLIEKACREYFRQPLRRHNPEDIVLPVAHGGGAMLVNPATWWDEINERE